MCLTKYTVFFISIVSITINTPAFSEVNVHEASVKLEYAEKLREIGKSLFFDKRLSADGTISCSSCHLEELAFTDGLAVAKGINQQQGTRNTPTLVNVAFNQSLFWDGRRETLEEQAMDPFTNPLEHGFSNVDEVATLVRNIPEYTHAFREILGISEQEIASKHISLAIAEYEKTMISTGSPFDDYYVGKVDNSISASAARGFTLFTGRAKCSTCHTIDQKEALFTDHKFHSIGIGFSKISERLAEITHTIASKRDNIDSAVISNRELSELGRFIVTLKPSDIGKFKTPTLRNIAITAPYMHDGSVATLEEAINIEIYYRGISDGRTIILSPKEKSELIDFLNTLTEYKYQQDRQQASESE